MKDVADKTKNKYLYVAGFDSFTDYNHEVIFERKIPKCGWRSGLVSYKAIWRNSKESMGWRLLKNSMLLSFQDAVYFNTECVGIDCKVKRKWIKDDEALKHFIFAKSL